MGVSQSSSSAQAYEQRNYLAGTFAYGIQRKDDWARLSCTGKVHDQKKLGYRHEVVDRQLAHAPRNRIDATYDRAQFLPDRRKMMQEWADYLDNVQKNPATVIQRDLKKHKDVVGEIGTFLNSSE